MKTTTTSHIRGATFSRAGFAKLPEGAWSAQCTAKAPNSALSYVMLCDIQQLLEPTSTGFTHSICVRYVGSTTTWPITTLTADIKFSDQTGSIRYTNRFSIVVSENITE